MEITQLIEVDFENYLEHYSRNLNQSGIDSLPIFNFFKPGSFVLDEETKNRVIERIKKEYEEPFWERVLVYKESGSIKGHLLFRGAGNKESSHRVTLMMGIEKELVGKGIGTALLKKGIRWCQSQSFIDWIDLGVFEENIPAQKLYQRFSFEEVSKRKDAYRLDGKSLTLISMQKKI